MHVFMMRWVKHAAILSLLVLVGATAKAEENAQNAMQKRGQAIQMMISASGDESLQRFIDENLSPELQQSLSRDDLLELLRKIRKKGAAAGAIEGKVLGDDLVQYTYHSGQGSYTLQFRIDTSPPFKIAEMTFDKAPEVGRDRHSVEPMTWDTLTDRFDTEEEAGFSGAVLVIRDGEVVLDKGYGMANQERGIPNTPETLFAVGSVPIDFTKAAILQLEDVGKLKTSDRITKYFDNVPDDKQTMTLDHLMTGGSGLPNFHGIPGQDENLDLSWIDRATAIERIFGRELLFAPGEGNAHSHSAWGVLTAVVEIVSEQSYGEFLKTHFFEPAGMGRTGLYPITRRFDENEVAVGYGSNSFGEINSPIYWGETSWLVMGSGGMVSNPRDLYKWVQAIRNGKILSPAAQEKYWSSGPLSGGNDRGFFCMYTEGPGTMMFICSNSHERMNDPASQLGRGLARLVMSDNAPPFRLGIAFDRNPKGVVIVEVVPGGAAEKAGIKVGDLVISVNGHRLGSGADKLIVELLQEGKPMKFEVERDGTEVTIVVVPDRVEG